MTRFALILAVFLPFAASHAHAATVSDDFSTDSGLWTYTGAGYGGAPGVSAYRDPANGYVVLTRPDWYYSTGQIWLAKGWNGPFKVTFRYLIGGGSGADGLIFMFNKQTGYVPDVGGTLGFTLPPHASLTPVPGYGVEVDTFTNWGWEPTNAPHMALVKDTVANNLAWAEDTWTRDGLWHTVEVKVEASAVTVSVDGLERFTWTGSIDRTFSGIGFSGSTGALTNWHLIDDVKVQDLSIDVAIDIKPGDAENTFNNNGAGVLPVAILGSATFDVKTVDPSSVKLESLPVKVTGKNHPLASYQDVNGDGFLDLVVQIADDAVVFQPGVSTAELTGALLDGTPILGHDSIRIVP